MKKLTRRSDSVDFKVDQPLAHELPYWDFADDLVVLIDGTLVMALALDGLPTEAKDAADLNRLCQDLRSLLNSLPDGMEFGLSFERRPCDQSVLTRHASNKATCEAINWVSDVRVATLEGETQEEHLLSSHLHLYLYKRFQTGNKKPGFFAPPKRFISVKEEEFQTAALDLRQALDTVCSALSAVGIAAKVLGAENIRNEIYRFLNPVRSQNVPSPQISQEFRKQEFTTEELKAVPQLAIPSPREQLAFSDLLVQRDALFYGGLYHRCISLKTLPEYTHATMASWLTDLSIPYTLHIHIRVPEQGKELASLQARRRMAHSMSQSQDGRPTDLESEAKLHSTEDLLRDLINTGQKLFYFQMVVLLSASNRQELEQHTQLVLRKVRELNGAEGLVETVGTFKVWKSILPAGNLAAPRSKRIKTDNLADFLPVYEPYRGNEPVCLFRNRYDALVAYDPFDSSLPNYNCLITGSSGSGKSFVSNQVLLQYLSHNPAVFIVDVGGSYRKLCDLVGGQYVELSASAVDSTARINPFALPPGELRPSARKIKFLLAMLETILADSDKKVLPKLHKSQLEEELINLYQDNRNAPPTFTDLVSRLAHSAHSELKSYASMLYPWSGDRPYGQLLDVEQGFQTNADFVVFDLKGLSVYPDLQSVMLLIITDFILGRIDTTSRQRKQVLMDECWELLKAPASQGFMEYCVRTLRKSGSGITFVTQGLEEIVTSPVGPAILSNTATKLVLSQKGDLEPVRKLLKLNDQQMNLIGSLTQHKGYFSEAFLVCNQESSVIRIQPTPIEYWIATSDAADNTALKEAQINQPDVPLVETLHQLSVKYPHGVGEEGK